MCDPTYRRASASMFASTSAPQGKPQTSPPAKAAASTFVWRCFACTYQPPTLMTTAPSPSSIGRSSAKSTTTWPPSSRPVRRQPQLPHFPCIVLPRTYPRAQCASQTPECEPHDSRALLSPGLQCACSHRFDARRVAILSRPLPSTLHAMSEPAENSDATVRRIGRPFQPGQSGNPGGRPKGVADVSRCTGGFA